MFLHRALWFFSSKKHLGIIFCFLLSSLTPCILYLIVNYVFMYAYTLGSNPC